MQCRVAVPVVVSDVDIGVETHQPMQVCPCPSWLVIFEEGKMYLVGEGETQMGDKRGEG